MVTPDRGFAEGQWYTNSEGDAVRIDRVHAGWVYFVVWHSHRHTGAPKRMLLGVFERALENATMVLELERYDA